MENEVRNVESECIPCQWSRDGIQQSWIKRAIYPWVGGKRAWEHSVYHGKGRAERQVSGSNQNGRENAGLSLAELDPRREVWLLYYEERCII